eukprot:COSAG06_NODE_4515_length_4189_cov_12.834230_10_plen_130_part_00
MLGTVGRWVEVLTEWNPGAETAFYEPFTLETITLPRQVRENIRKPLKKEAFPAGLSDASALRVVEAIFGLKLPGVTSRFDLESALTPEFFATVVYEESVRALAAVRTTPFSAPVYTKTDNFAKTGSGYT